MPAGITLRQGRPSTALWETIQKYYERIGAPEGYAGQRIRLWKEDPDIIAYSAVKESAVIGWILYQPHRSSIEEIVVTEQWTDNELEKTMVDALISRESLVSSEVLKEDREKYTWMVEYGFRPTRSLTTSRRA